jgi:hypothetical protein
VHVLVKIKLLLKDKMHGEYNVKFVWKLLSLFYQAAFQEIFKFKPAYSVKLWFHNLLQVTYKQKSQVGMDTLKFSHCNFNEIYKRTLTNSNFASRQGFILVFGTLEAVVLPNKINNSSQPRELCLAIFAHFCFIITQQHSNP